ncbi:hemolysin secretion protein D [Rhodospirillum rubrum]|uniref:HlyD family secretion protein n=1 Tax=Rhodospirillum rubrum TaxID=1085 RepID=UPI00190513DA|nr:HlyD family secretion protein [Rhodospirillum rubrum]MBK1664533.1 hemolysin secretion protein D [Rhodospirillum rubrum]MBK1676212.1 hemolysin secretion protein D [Rhodospirillum rubrum]
MSQVKHFLPAGIALSIGLIGALLVLYAWNLPPFRGSVETTDNAYVRAQVTMISPQSAGYVTAVAVHDFQTVKAGTPLFQIDDRIYAQKLKQAQAALAMKRAALENSGQSERSAQARLRSGEAEIASAVAARDVARSTARRTEALLARGVSTQSAGDQARSTLAQAEASVRKGQAALDVAREDLRAIIVNRQALQADIANAQAAVELATIDLRNTSVVAPVDGTLGEIGVRLGQYVSAGTQLAALVPERRWVIANFKETQLAGIQVGQMARLSVDALGGAALSGHVEAFSPATGSEFTVLKSDNATGNFTKVTQRLPVRIAIDPDQAQAGLLAPGMSVVVRIDTAPRGRDGIHPS